MLKYIYIKLQMLTMLQCIIFWKKLYKERVLEGEDLRDASTHFVDHLKSRFEVVILTKICLKVLYFWKEVEKSSQLWGFHPQTLRWLQGLHGGSHPDSQFVTPVICYSNLLERDCNANVITVEKEQK